MLRFSNFQLIIILFIFLSFIFYKLFHKDHDSLILATIGEEHITVDQFINNYSFGSSKLKPKNNTKLFYLKAMINEMILAQELSKYKQHIIKDDDPRLDLLEQELLVENIFEIEVDNKISVTNEEILKSIIKSRKRVKITYLYSANHDMILQCQDSLQKGYDFHQLSEINYINNNIIIEETPYLLEGQITESFKDIIFELPPGIFSKIITKDFGYYIIKINDIVTASLSDAEIENFRSTHEKIIRNKKSNQLAKDFVDTYMSPKKIIIKSKSFNNLAENLFNIYKKFGTIPFDTNSFRYNNLYGDWLNDTLIVHKDGIIKTNQILNYIKIRPIHFDYRDIDSFSSDLENYFSILIRDYFLVMESHDNYDINYKNIISQKNLWKRKLIVDDYFNQLNVFPMNTIIRNNNETNRDFDNNILRNRIENEESYSRLNMKLDSLKSKIKISINLELLSSLDVIDDVSGHFPELQLFKLGLPYLREAYPTPNIMFAYIK